MSIEGFPAFYHAAHASGLIDRATLRSVLQSLREDFGRSVRHHRSVESASLREAALIQGGASPESVGQDGPSDLDYRLADAFIEMGRLNAWQASQLLAGRTKFSLGDFWIVDSIGQGGYGHVFLGREERSARRLRAVRMGAPVGFIEEECPLAIKVLPRARATPELIARFEHEIEAQRNLSHPNLVRFITSGRDGNVHFMVHEYVDGGDLRRRMRGGAKFPYEVAAAIVLQIADALQYLHRSGVVHRDIKPSNILISSDGHAKLADMGLALRFDARDFVAQEGGPESNEVSPDEESVLAEAQLRLERQLDRAGLRGKVAGTIDYIAPDQIRSPRHPSPAWDIYSLGCAFYQMLVGTVPFPKESARQKFYAHLHQQVIDPRVYHPSIPYDLASLTLSMLAKDPARRIGTAREIVERLTPWVPPQSFFNLLGVAEAEESPDSESDEQVTTASTTVSVPSAKVRVLESEVPYAMPYSPFSAVSDGVSVFPETPVARNGIVPPPLPGKSVQPAPKFSGEAPPVRLPVAASAPPEIDPRPPAGR